MREYFREDVELERRGRRRAYRIMVVALAVALFAAWSWKTTSDRLASVRSVVEAQQESLRVQALQAESTQQLLRREQEAAGRFEAGSMSWEEKAKAMQSQVSALKRKVKSEQGKRGPMQRKINEQQEHICNLEQMLRDKKVRLYMKPECEGYR